MNKNYLFFLLLFFVFPLKFEASTTIGQIQFFDENPEESRTLAPTIEEKTEITSSFPKGLINYDLNKKKKKLLQTNDKIEYGISFIGILLFFYVVYKLRRNVE